MQICKRRLAFYAIHQTNAFRQAFEYGSQSQYDYLRNQYLNAKSCCALSTAILLRSKQYGLLVQFSHCFGIPSAIRSCARDEIGITMDHGSKGLHTRTSQIKNPIRINTVSRLATSTTDTFTITVIGSVQNVVRVWRTKRG